MTNHMGFVLSPESRLPAPGVLGIDIGGANLKLADSRGNARSEFFPMWSDHARLGEAIGDLLSSFEPACHLAVTMTGELADCFADRSVGVAGIVDAVEVASVTHQLPASFYSVDGAFVSSEQAKRVPDAVAASNWHASANWIAQNVFANEQTRDGIVVDIGSTTTDLTPIKNGKVATIARTDFDRLVEGSLVYIGCGRTPVCSLVSSLRFEDQIVPVMNEVFATVDDAMLLLGHCGEDSLDCQTADQQPRTKVNAANRIARMIGLDHRSVSVAQAVGLSQQVVEAAQEAIRASFSRLDSGGQIVVIGHGGSLVPWQDKQQAGGRPMIRMDECLGGDVSRCFPAFAVAGLLAGAVQETLA